MRQDYAISADALASVLDSAVLAARNGGTEICGLLVAQGHGLLTPLMLRNKARRAGIWAFYVGEVRTAVAQAARNGHEVVGTFHSHPVGTAVPGSSDIANALDDSLILIIDCTTKRYALWHIKSGAAQQRRLVTRLTSIAAKLILDPLAPNML